MPLNDWHDEDDYADENDPDTVVWSWSIDDDEALRMMLMVEVESLDPANLRARAADLLEIRQQLIRQGLPQQARDCDDERWECIARAAKLERAQRHLDQ